MYQSGQMGQTVNLLALPSVVRIHPHPQTNCGSNSIDRASAFQAESCGFEPRLPLQEERNESFSLFFYAKTACKKKNAKNVLKYSRWRIVFLYFCGTIGLECFLQQIVHYRSNRNLKIKNGKNEFWRRYRRSDDTR